MRDLSGADWVGNLLAIARSMAAVAEIAPFPYIKTAANAIVALLETMKVPSSLSTV
jgi:hypothetical protein